MKNLILFLLVFSMIFACYPSRRAYLEQRTQQLRDSIRMAQENMKKDDDGDGVINVYDSCGSTPKNARVYANGCPMDVDGDGVIDLYDKCVTVPGSSKNGGCPEE